MLWAVHLCAAGGLPIPGLQPKGPTNPFAFEVLGVAVVHLLLQAAAFGTATVLLDVGLLQLLWPVWRAMKARWGPRHSSNAALAVAAGTGGAAAPVMSNACDDSAAAPLLLKNAEEGRRAVTSTTTTAAAAGRRHPSGAAAFDDDDVAAERQAVEAGEGLDDAMVGQTGCTGIQGCNLRSQQAVML